MELRILNSVADPDRFDAAKRNGFLQCCGAGAEIILGPGAGAENKFKETFFAVSVEDARMIKR